MGSKPKKRLAKLFNNSRFWILMVGINLSILIAGFIQLYIPSGTLQIIRIEQCYGFISILLLYIAILASPLTKAFPNISFKESYIHARRAIGVLTFYYAFLHTYLTFFKQLDGFAGIKYLDTKYSESLVFGIIALTILFIMTITSLDLAVDKIHFKNWKLLHRLVYFSIVAIFIHVILIGPHYTGLNLLSAVTYIAFCILAILEFIRISRVLNAKRSDTKGKVTK